MAMNPREVAREVAREEIDDTLRQVFRFDRANPDPGVPPPHEALAFTRRQMARHAAIQKWRGWLVLGAASLVLSTAGGDFVKWLLKRLALFQ